MNKLLKVTLITAIMAASGMCSGDGNPFPQHAPQQDSCGPMMKLALGAAAGYTAYKTFCDSFEYKAGFTWPIVNIVPEESPDIISFRVVGYLIFKSPHEARNAAHEVVRVSPSALGEGRQFVLRNKNKSSNSVDQIYYLGDVVKKSPTRVEIKKTLIKDNGKWLSTGIVGVGISDTMYDSVLFDHASLNAKPVNRAMIEEDEFDYTVTKMPWHYKLWANCPCSQVDLEDLPKYD